MFAYVCLILLFVFFFLLAKRIRFAMNSLSESLIAYGKENSIKRQLNQEFIEKERQLKLEILESKLKDLQEREVRRNIKWR